MRASFSARLGGVCTVLVLAVAGTSLAEQQAAKPTPACFGAASRDPEKPCVNKKLRLSVTPTPDEAVIEPNADCDPVSLRLQPFVCTFGLAPGSGIAPTMTVALVGDSHAVHWRAALAPIAVVSHWVGKSLTRSSCPFSTTVPTLEDADTQKHCIRWNKQVPAWFKRHKEVSTVFISEHIQVRVQAPKGADQFERKVQGYMQQWKTFPPTVKHVVIIKDTPRATGNTADCVSEAIDAKKPAGPACAIKRSFAVKKDPAVEAARRLGGRFSSVDLTDFFCSSRFCLPVIGGALVYKDPGHMTRVFGETMAPYLFRALLELPAFAPAPGMLPPGSVR